MSSELKKYLAIGARQSQEFPKNDGAVGSFSDFVEFCVDVGKDGKTLSALIGLDVSQPLRPTSLRGKEQPPEKPKV